MPVSALFGLARGLWLVVVRMLQAFGVLPARLDTPTPPPAPPPAPVAASSVAPSLTADAGGGGGRGGGVSRVALRRCVALGAVLVAVCILEDLLDGV